MHQLDARNLLCPMPVIRTQDFVRKLHDGEQLEVLCSDPGALHDIPAWCRIHGHRIIQTSTEGDLIRITLQVVEDTAR